MLSIVCMIDWFYMVNTCFGHVGDVKTGRHPSILPVFLQEVYVRFQYHMDNIILPPLDYTSVGRYLANGRVRMACSSVVRQP